MPDDTFDLPQGDFDFGGAPGEAELPPDPLASVEYEGDAEVDSPREAEAIRTAFLQRGKDERKRFGLATDSEYWFCVCFQSREQKDAFLAAMGWAEVGDKYLDGRAVAERQGVPLPAADVPFVKARPDRLLDELSLPLDD